MSSPRLTNDRFIAPRCCYALSLLTLFLLAGLKPALAQIGNSNPAGPAGAFNGSITTGCAYDPATGNETRQVTDLSLPSVGAYPLAFTRISNSRAATTTTPFGIPGTWEHSYDWFMVQNQSSGLKPSSYEVVFPDGCDETFFSSGGPVSKEIRDRITPLNTSTMLTYLVLPDGGKVEFATTRQVFGTGYSTCSSQQP